MMNLMRSTLSFLLSDRALSLTNHGELEFKITVWLSGYWITKIALLLSQMSIFSLSWLVEIGATQIEVITGNAIALWYLYESGWRKLRILFFSIVTSKIGSVESLVRNAKWLEREQSELFDFNLQKKTDRRALFLTPILFWGVLNRGFPVGGFFELNLSLPLGKLVVVHTNWLG